MYSNFSYYTPAIDTVNTTRILGDVPLTFNNYVTKVIYPSSKVKWRPNAIILVPFTSYHYGLLASPLIHFPINAPIVFTNANYLSQETFNEIIRLSPTGKDVPAKVLIVGPVAPIIELQLLNAGLSVIRITGNNPIRAASEAMEFRYKMAPDSMEGNKNIMIVSADDHTESVPAAYYSAHMGVPILFTYRDKLPEITKQKLIKYNNKNIFIIGGEQTISDKVFNEIQSIAKSKVDRIGGSTCYEVAVNFSKYYSQDSMFGWNINTKDGWAFCFGTPNNWVYNLSACIFAHLGKHPPLLYIEPFEIPKATSEYVLSVKPVETHPPKPQFLHGFILGGFQQISPNMQIKLEEILNI
ncbi:cell wall-binding repeat-containing protein [Clostridium algoriphilum]|uniref:cell wall-binding repeat-containing protein n=1 Tax=Clostridium algoriphilum TaxID=198347 RepID=UPI001CF5E1C3|nr:cell wall-binding repeat-containing protein [Clostridium algoriphilum]MCB2292784.1 cell wall-binding repeat-containing protein [Clostridium algoriphilum]